MRFLMITVLLAAMPVFAQRQRAVAPVPVVWSCSSFFNLNDALVSSKDIQTVVKFEDKFLVFFVSSTEVSDGVCSQPQPSTSSVNNPIQFSVINDPAVALAIYSSITGKSKGMFSHKGTWIIWWPAIVLIEVRPM